MPCAAVDSAVWNSLSGSSFALLKKQATLAVDKKTSDSKELVKLLLESQGKMVDKFNKEVAKPAIQQVYYEDIQADDVVSKQPYARSYLEQLPTPVPISQAEKPLPQQAAPLSSPPLWRVCSSASATATSPP